MSHVSIPAGTHIGHVHLKVSNIDRAVDFYHGLMGFDLLMRFGDRAAFLSAGGYHHHLGLNTWESADGEHHRRLARQDSIILQSTILSGATWQWH